MRGQDRAKVTLVAKSLRASKKGTVSFSVGCPATEQSCKVIVKLKNGTTTVASKTVSVKGGKTKTVTLVLNKAARKVLAKRGSLKVSSVVTRDRRRGQPQDDHEEDDAPPGRRLSELSTVELRQEPPRLDPKTRTWGGRTRLARPRPTAGRAARLAGGAGAARPASVTRTSRWRATAATTSATTT